MIDADLSGYFDSIPHAELMKSVARRVSDGQLLALIKAFLEMAVEESDGRAGYDGAKIAFVDQGHTGEDAAQQASDHGIKLEVVKHTEAKKEFVLLPRRWVVERTFGWLGRFRRLARDYERLTKVLAGWHWLAFLILIVKQVGFQSA